MADTIYLGRDGQQMGPYDWARIAAMASAGQVRPGDLAWHDGMAGWMPAEQVLGRLGLSLATTPSPPFNAAPPPRTAAPKAAGGAGGIGGRLARLIPGKGVAKS